MPFPHPELPVGWTADEGLTELSAALAGHHGLARQRLAELATQTAAVALRRAQRDGNAALVPARIFNHLGAAAVLRGQLDQHITAVARGDAGDRAVMELAVLCLLEQAAAAADEDYPALPTPTAGSDQTLNLTTTTVDGGTTWTTSE